MATCQDALGHGGKRTDEILMADLEDDLGDRRFKALHPLEKNGLVAGNEDGAVAIRNRVEHAHHFEKRALDAETLTERACLGEKATGGLAPEHAHAV